MPDEPVGCAKPTGTVIGDSAPKDKASGHESKEGESAMVMAKVGGKGPDLAGNVWKVWQPEYRNCI